MSMDTIVAFVRNGLCCVKDLQLFSTTVLYNPSYVSLFYKLPAPLDETMPLEVAIGTCQFYAVVTMILSGSRSITAGLSKMRDVRRLKRVHEDQSKISNRTTAHYLVEQSLEKESIVASRGIIVGISVMSIGFSFVWLVANSLHVTQTNMIGGVQGLIHALTVAEIALAVLLYYMLVDGISKVKDSQRIRYLRKILIESNGRLANVTTKGFLDVQIYGWIVHGGWKPFWAGIGSELMEGEEEKMLAREMTDIDRNVDALFAEENRSEKDNADEVENTTLKYAVEVASARLEREAWIAKSQGCLEYLYFAFNFVAFYGYLICVLCFYFEDGESESGYWNMMKGGLNNTNADWTGNFAGDLMWTVEPFTALIAPHVVYKMSPKMKSKVE